MQETFKHAVKINIDKCRGCTACVKKCPVEAIRVRGGKAEILASRCIDCGLCMSECPFHAFYVRSEEFAVLSEYENNVLLLPPSFYAQFPPEISEADLAAGCKELGFDSVFNLAAASEFVALEIENYLASYKGPKPLISSTCPTVLRLIQVAFPELIEQIVPVLPPVDLAAVYIKRKAEAAGRSAKKQGVWFATPCPGKKVNGEEPVAAEKSFIDGYFSLNRLYALLRKILPEVRKRKEKSLSEGKRNFYPYGLLWGASGGESRSAGLENSLSVSGSRNIKAIFEAISLNKMPGLDYVEVSACEGGCVGGPLVAENRFVAALNLRLRIRLEQENVPAISIIEKTGPEDDEVRRKILQKDTDAFEFPPSDKYIKRLNARPMMQLDDDIMQAMKKFEQMEEVMQRLPGLNCGACGAPSCKGLAEDVVQGKASEIDCIFKLRSSVKKIARGMFDLAKQLPVSSVAEEEEEDLKVPEE